MQQTFAIVQVLNLDGFKSDNISILVHALSPLIACDNDADSLHDCTFRRFSAECGFTTIAIIPMCSTVYSLGALDLQICPAAHFKGVL
jgi:hypothetical protein